MGEKIARAKGGRFQTGNSRDVVQHKCPLANEIKETFGKTRFWNIFNTVHHIFSQFINATFLLADFKGYFHRQKIVAERFYSS